MANLGRGLAGAGAGASAGATLGSAIPGIGNVVGGLAGGLLGGLGGLFGGDDPQAPTPIQAPPVATAQLQNAVDPSQLAAQYQNSNNALAQQAAFTQALQAQNGIGNQSSVFNQLQGVANGTGPNPAQAQLANATGANVANQAALMAGQRGASSNVGLMARQIGQQGAGIQQNAAGQAAALQANQSLGALGQMGGLASNQVGQQAGAVNAYNAAAQGLNGQMLGANAQQNNAALQQASNTNAYNLGATQSANAFNSPLALQDLKNSQAQSGGLMAGLGTAATALAPSLKGAFGSGENKIPGVDSLGSQPASIDAGRLKGPTNTIKPDTMNAISQGGMQMAAHGGVIGPRSKVGQHLKSGGMANASQVPAMVSPGEVYLSPEKLKAVAQGGANPMAIGERIPGTPKVGGAKDSYKNDTVAKTLEAGGVVLPRHVTQAPDAAAAAAKFVASILAKKGLRK